MSDDDNNIPCLIGPDGDNSEEDMDIPPLQTPAEIAESVMSSAEKLSAIQEESQPQARLKIIFIQSFIKLNFFSS